MKNIEKYLVFIDEMLEKLDLTDEKKQDYISQRNSIIARYNNPCLNLSMLSEFNAGKSTLINKLIRMNLLKTANLATTSIPTFLKNGKTKDLRIIATDVDGHSYDVTQSKQKKRLSELLEIALPEDPSQLISLLTSDELYLKYKITTVRDKINTVTVEIPDGRSVNNLCIIDTPGVNPGSDYAVNHAEQTIDILKNSADALMILFPSHQNYSKSFQDFLEAYARNYLEDAVFVVTQMDLVDEYERDEVISLVRVNLKNYFGIKNPKMMYCSAGRVGRDEEWTNQFEEFKEDLFQYITENRERIISRSLFELIKKLLTDINADLYAANDSLENTLNDLDMHSVPNLFEVLDERIHNAKSEIYKRKQTGKRDLEKHRNPLQAKIKTKIEDKLNGFGKRSEITSYVENQLAKDIEYECKVLSKDITAAQKGIKQITERARDQMKKSMVDYYGVIQKSKQDSSNLTVTTTEKNISQRLSQEFSKMNVSLNGSLELASAAGGAVIAGAIFVALGPVGWIIGGLIGLFGSDMFFVDRARSKVTDAVFPKIPSIVSKAITDGGNALDRNVSESVKYLNEIQNELIQSYSGLYAECLEEFESSKQLLIGEMKYNKRCIRRAEALLKELKHQID